MTRGDVVTVAMQGDFGKPRPAVIVQVDDVSNVIASVVVCPITTASAQSSIVRVSLSPTEENGLRAPSHIMTEKVSALRADRIGSRIGKLDLIDMKRLESALAYLLGLGHSEVSH